MFSSCTITVQTSSQTPGLDKHLRKRQACSHEEDHRRRLHPWLWDFSPNILFAAEKMRRRMQRRTVRMSLASSARRHLCTGRRAYSACASRHHAPRPLVAVQYGSFGRLPSGEPGGWSRPDFGHLCYRSLRRPAAHPHRSPARRWTIQNSSVWYLRPLQSMTELGAGTSSTVH
jgi:hypothetical protein